MHLQVLLLVLQVLVSKKQVNLLAYGLLDEPYTGHGMITPRSKLQNLNIIGTLVGPTQVYPRRCLPIIIVTDATKSLQV